MKTKTLSLLLLFVLGMLNILQAQTTITITTSGGVFVPNPTPPTADFTKPITVIAPSGVTNFVIEKTSSNISDLVKQQNGSYTINVSTTSDPAIKVQLKGDNMQALTLVIKNVSTVAPGNGNNLASYDQASDYLSQNVAAFNSAYRYDRKGNRAYFFFDQNGILLGPAPVNVDADDFINLYIAVPETLVDNYSLEMVGEYNPSDLAIRPYTPIPSGAAQGTGVSGPPKYTYIHRTFGPFTSDKAQIKIYGKDNDGKKVVLNQVDVKINKLYNVAIGASFVSTSLANPDFDVSPINGTSNNTIRKINDGKRTLVTFNVIYYWKPTIDWVTGKLKNSSHITRGRDILKEATFWERLNPIFGVALSDKWRENLFMGGNFEFTRGGSISAGWHYGKVQSLVDDKFKLGEDIFTGTKDDIKLTNSWKWNGFIGITVDTRIFNALFSHN